jgi:hypothetical protein
MHLAKGVRSIVVLMAATAIHAAARSLPPGSAASHGTSTPEAGTLSLLGLGLIAVAWHLRRITR